MFHSYQLVMRIVRDQLALADAVPAAFDCLRGWFAPRRFVYSLDDGELRYLTRGERGDWDGEERTSDALTRCPPGDASGLIGELRDVLAAAQPRQLWLGARGALLHRAPATAEAAWYGRWRLLRALHDLIEASLSWTDETRALELRFPIAGYPLTAVVLRGQPDGDRVLDAGDAAAAAANRAQLRAALAQLPTALGLSRHEVRWELGGDVTALAGRFPADAAAIEELVAGL